MLKRRHRKTKPEEVLVRNAILLVTGLILGLAGNLYADVPAPQPTPPPPAPSEFEQNLVACKVDKIDCQKLADELRADGEEVESGDILECEAELLEDISSKLSRVLERNTEKTPQVVACIAA